MQKLHLKIKSEFVKKKESLSFPNKLVYKFDNGFLYREHNGVFMELDFVHGGVNTDRRTSCLRYCQA